MEDRLEENGSLRFGSQEIRLAQLEIIYHYYTLWDNQDFFFERNVWGCKAALHPEERRVCVAHLTLNARNPSWLKDISGKCKTICPAFTQSVSSEHGNTRGPRHLRSRVSGGEVTGCVRECWANLTVTQLGTVHANPAPPSPVARSSQYVRGTLAKWGGKWHREGRSQGNTVCVVGHTLCVVECLVGSRIPFVLDVILFG